MNCPGLEQLTDYIDDRLKAKEAASVAEHFATGCDTCLEYREWYERVRMLAATDDSVAPPPWVFKRAVRIFGTGRSRPRLAEQVGRMIASLVFDSLDRPAIAGVRSTETESRQLLYRAGDYSIDLQIAPAGQSRCDLIGQVLKEGEVAFDSVAGLKLELAGHGGVHQATATDRLGEFTISEIQCGDYDLKIELPHGSITIAGLPVVQS